MNNNVFYIIFLDKERFNSKKKISNREATSQISICWVAVIGLFFFRPPLSKWLLINSWKNGRQMLSWEVQSFWYGFVNALCSWPPFGQGHFYRIGTASVSISGLGGHQLARRAQVWIWPTSNRKDNYFYVLHSQATEQFIYILVIASM